MRSELLRVEYATKYFEGTRLVEDCVLSLAKGEIRGIVGLNASNKEVLIDVVTGKAKMDAGRMYFEEEVYSPKNRREAEEKGIFYIGEDLDLQFSWDILNNILMKPTKDRRRIFIQKRKTIEEMKPHMELVGLDRKYDCPVPELSKRERQKLSIVKALNCGAKLIVLDYPIEMYTVNEIADFKQVLRNLKNAEISVLLVGCRYDQLTVLCDSITVMRSGRTVENVQQKDFEGLNILNLLLGYEFGGRAGRKKMTDRKEVAISAQDISADENKGFSFCVYKKEILGVIDVAGDSGVGIANLLCGIDRMKHGVLKVGGREVTMRAKRDAVKSGIYYIPQTDAEKLLLPDFSIEENFMVSAVKQYSNRAGIIDASAVKTISARFSQRLGINRTWNLGKLSMNVLSKIEKRRTLLYRYELIKPQLLVMNGFTKGLDVIAKEQLFDDIRRIAEQGGSVMFITPNIAEAFEIGDRVLIVNGGNVIAEVDNFEIQNIGKIEGLIRDVFKQ